MSALITASYWGVDYSSVTVISSLLDILIKQYQSLLERLSIYHYVTYDKVKVCKASFILLWGSHGKIAGTPGILFDMERDLILDIYVCVCAEEWICETGFRSGKPATIFMVFWDLQTSIEVKEAMPRCNLAPLRLQRSCSPHFPCITRTILFCKEGHRWEAQSLHLIKGMFCMWRWLQALIKGLSVCACVCDSAVCSNTL